MNSPLLALFARALREDVRSKMMYWARGGLVGVVLLTLLMTQSSMGWGGAPGLVFFTSVIYANLLFISLAGLSYFASAITEEKEEMTLGLLRMTNLNPLAILLGKSASRQFGALLLLASQLPFVLMAVSLGGVAIGQILAAYAALAAYALFLGNLALFFSVALHRTTKAAMATGAVMIVFFFGAYFVEGLLLPGLKYYGFRASVHPGERLQWVLEHWLGASPLVRLDDILTTGFMEAPVGFQVLSNLALGLVFFLLAWAVFDFFCSDLPEAAPSRNWFTRGKGRRWRLFEPSRPWRHALIWKDFYFLGGGRLMMVVKFLLYGGLLASIYYSMSRSVWRGSESLREAFGYTTFWLMAAFCALELAWIAGGVFRQERRWKTWSSLAMLPYSLRRIAYHKVLGCALGLLPALVFMALGAFIVLPDVMEWVSRPYFRFRFEVVTGVLFGALMVVFFYHVVASLSLRLKWGALPLSFVLVYLGSFFAVGMGVFIFREGVFVLYDPLLLVLTGALHVSVGRRLKHLASED